MPISEARRKANDKWDKANKEKKKYITWKSYSKGFILNMANKEDLIFLKDLIEERLNEKDTI